MIDKQLLKNLAEKNGITLTDEALSRFETYATELVEYNQKVNLTAITDPYGIAVKHFLDCIIPLTFMGNVTGKTLIDVGAGAGFPSLPMKIASDIDVTMLDSLNKRVTFLNYVSEKIGVKITAHHLRAEEGGQKPYLREKFDFATARAVASLSSLCEYCLPFVKVGGYFVALKGFEVEDEIKSAENALKTLGGEIEKVYKYDLDEENKRSVVMIKKVRPTPPKYPRPSAKIAKSPL
jgi:16S rRNA (guanine(527)-N(7))-methyltransferase RsmG